VDFQNRLNAKIKKKEKKEKKKGKILREYSE